MKAKRLDWNSEEVIKIISNPNLSLKKMSEILNKDIYTISRHRSKLGLKRLYSITGLDRPLTNKETKQRYNAKRKAIGWKYLYQEKNK